MVVKFISGMFRVLRDTTWPSRAQRWKDYLSVLEYTFFFAVVIYLFDKLISLGVVELLKRF